MTLYQKKYYRTVRCHKTGELTLICAIKMLWSLKQYNLLRTSSLPNSFLLDGCKVYILWCHNYMNLFEFMFTCNFSGFSFRIIVVVLNEIYFYWLSGLNINLYNLNIENVKYIYAPLMLHWKHPPFLHISAKQTYH